MEHVTLWPDSSLADSKKSVYLAGSVAGICDEYLIAYSEYQVPVKSAPAAPIPVVVEEPAPAPEVPEEEPAQGIIAGIEFDENNQSTEEAPIEWEKEAEEEVVQAVEEPEIVQENQEAQSIFDSPFAKWILAALAIVVILQIVIIIYLVRNYNRSPEGLLR